MMDRDPVVESRIPDTEIQDLGSIGCICVTNVDKWRQECVNIINQS